MKNGITRTYGIMAIAIIMAFMSLLTGTKGSPYTVFWIYAAYLSYKGDIKTLKSYIVILIWINAIISAGVILFVDLKNLQWIIPGVESRIVFIVATGIPLAVKVAILLRLNIILKNKITATKHGVYMQNISDTSALNNYSQNTRIENNVQRYGDSTKKYTEENSSFNKFSSEADTPYKPKNETATFVTSDSALNRLFAMANEEIESNNKDKGLWARSFAESNGNINEATAKYLKARVSELVKIESQKSNLEKENDFLNKKRANQNDESKSLFDLAIILSKGDGEFSKDLKAAFDKMQKSAFLGYGRAQYNLSLMYWKGEGVVANTTYAYAWCLIASQKEIDAISNIRFMKSKMTDGEIVQGESIAKEIEGKIKEK